MLWGYFLASFQLITLTSLTEQSFFRSVAETEPWIFLLSLTIGLLSIGGNALLTYLISNYPLSKVMPFSLTLPFFSVLGGYFILSENIHLKALLGGILVFIGVLFAMLKSQGRNLKEIS